MVNARFCHETQDGAGWWVVNANRWYVQCQTCMWHVTNAANELTAWHLWLVLRLMPWEGVSSFVWCHVSPNLSLSESDCFRSAFAHLHLMTWVLMTYIKDTEVEHERTGRRSTSKQDLLSLFFFLILVDYLFVAFIFWRCSIAWWYSLSFVRCFWNLFLFVLIRVSFMSCFVLLSKQMFLHDILVSRVPLGCVPLPG